MLRSSRYTNMYCIGVELCKTAGGFTPEKHICCWFSPEWKAAGLWDLHGRERSAEPKEKFHYSHEKSRLCQLKSYGGAAILNRFSVAPLFHYSIGKGFPLPTGFPLARSQTAKCLNDIALSEWQRGVVIIICVILEFLLSAALFLLALPKCFRSPRNVATGWAGSVIVSGGLREIYYEPQPRPSHFSIFPFCAL